MKSAGKKQSGLPRAFDLPDPEDIIAFIRDAETRAALVAAFGGRTPVTNIGGIETAIAYLTNDPSPENIVVDVSGVPYPVESVDRLADVCRPGTFVLAIGDVNDVRFYHSLRELGVADYLVKPVSSEALRAALITARRLKTTDQEATARPLSEVIAVTGARGGVGTSLVASSLAWFMSEALDQKTMLVDLDLHFGSTALSFDVEPSRGLRDALTNPDRIDNLFIASASTEITQNLCLLASEEPLDNAVFVKPDALECLGTELRHNFQRVIFDLPCRNLDVLRQGIAQANTLVVVTDFSIASLRDSGRIMTLAKDCAPKTRRMAIGNRAGASKGELGADQFEKVLGMPLAATIPEDGAAVLRALNSGELLPKCAPHSKAATALRNLAVCFDSEQTTPTSLLSRLFGSAKKEPA